MTDGLKCPPPLIYINADGCPNMTAYVNRLMEADKAEADALSASDKNVVLVTTGKISQALTATDESHWQAIFV
jgi:hypothetical protein